MSREEAAAAIAHRIAGSTTPRRHEAMLLLLHEAMLLLLHEAMLLLLRSSGDERVDEVRRAAGRPGQRAVTGKRRKLSGTHQNFPSVTGQTDLRV
jgi:hypothetical protein